MKLVWEFVESDECTYSQTITIPFEYESKDKFVFDVLEASDKFDWENKRHFPLLSESYNTKKEIEQIENNVFTLEEWFEKGKETKIFE